ncbi:MAG: 23S rRNA (pseudouridine(1915)-N(3))-methyltransferase RlmH [Desulfuromonas sp.]|nr:MAG: 23S rRNA (pseudouridine(1915)-N(3))-methyltransferase RlmH [Desulfuromonas sp.]
MKISLLCIGKLSAGWLQEGAGDYQKRLQRYLPIGIEELKEHKAGGKKADTRKIIQQEGSHLLARVPRGAYTVALDEQGELFSSEDLAGFIDRHMVDGTPEITFIIGGAYGLSDDVKQAARVKMSLTPMTLTHQMARVLLLEQLYRGMTILRNEPYHNR